MMVLMANVYFHIRRVIVDQAIRKAKCWQWQAFCKTGTIKLTWPVLAYPVERRNENALIDAVWDSKWQTSELTVP